MKTNYSKSIKNQFPILKTEIIYFDSAATSLKPKAMIDALNEYYSFYSFSSHNNVVNIIKQKIEQTRSNLKTYLNVEANEIVFTSGATEGLNIIAHGLSEQLQPQDEIILNKLEHSSNVLPWIEYANAKNLIIKWAEVNFDFKVDLESILAKITNKTKIVSFASTFNTTGTTNDIKTIVDKIKAKNPSIIVVVDYTQTVAYQRHDFKELDLDFAVFSAHKFFGPTGVGVLFGKHHLLKTMKPLVYGGGMNRTYDEQQIILKPSPQRFEAGTPNIAGIIALNESIEFAKNYLTNESLDHLLDLKTYLVTKLNEITSFELDVVATEKEAHTVLFNINDVSSEDLAAYFYKHNIIVRGGSSCSKLMEKTPLKQNNFVRVSFQIYNNFEEIDKLVEVLKQYSNPIDTLFKPDPTIC